MLEHKPNSIFESARKVLEHSQVQLKEGSFDKADEVKSLEALIKNPDPKRVKEYGGTKYVDMLRAKLDKLTNESIELDEAQIQPGDTVTAKKVVDWARGNGKTITPKGKLFSVEKIDGVFAHLSDQKGGKFEANIKDLTLQESIELEEIAGAELTEAISPQVEKIIYLVKELPTTDIKAFLDELATVFDQKADEEDSDDLPDIYRRVSKHIDNAFSVWFQEALDKL